MKRVRYLLVLAILFVVLIPQATAGQKVIHDYKPFMERVAASRTGSNSCGPPSYWDCNHGNVQADLIMAHSSLYMQTGEQKYLDWMHGYADHSSTNEQTGAGPGDYRSGEKDHGWYMVGYAMAYLAEPDSGKKSTYSSYLDNFANQGSIDAGPVSGGQVGNDHVAMVIGYSMAYGATKSSTVMGHFSGFGTQESGIGSRTHGEFMLGYAEAYLASGESGYKSTLTSLANTRPADPNIGCTTGHDCHNDEWQALMILGLAKAYEITGTASYKDEMVAYANVRPPDSCGPPDHWDCGDSTLQANSIFAYSKVFLITNDQTYLGYLDQMGDRAMHGGPCEVVDDQVYCSSGTGRLLMGLQILATIYPYFGELAITPETASTDLTLSVSVPVGDLPKVEITAGYFGRYDFSGWQQGVASCDCWLGETSYAGCLSGSSAGFQVPTPLAGNHSIRIACTNKAGYTNTLTSWVVVYPDGVHIENDDLSYVNTTTHQVELNYTSAYKVECSATLIGPSGTTNPPISGDGKNVGKAAIVLTLSPDGEYTLDVACQNTQGKQASFNLAFTVDILAPATTIAALEEYNVQPITVGATQIGDATAGIDTCRIFVDGDLHGTKAPTDGSVSWDLDLPEASYHLKICCYDKAGNEGCTEKISQIDLTPSATPHSTSIGFTTATPSPTPPPSGTPYPTLTPPPDVIVTATPSPTPAGPCEPPSEEAIIAKWNETHGRELTSLVTANKAATVTLPSRDAEGFASAREEAAALMRVMNDEYLKHSCDVGVFTVVFTDAETSYTSTRGAVEYLEAGYITDEQFINAIQEAGPTPLPPEEVTTPTPPPGVSIEPTPTIGAATPTEGPSPTARETGGLSGLSTPIPEPSATAGPIEPTKSPTSAPTQTPTATAKPEPTEPGSYVATMTPGATAGPTSKTGGGSTPPPTPTVESIKIDEVDVDFDPEMDDVRKEDTAKDSVAEALQSIAATRGEGLDTEEAEEYIKLAEDRIASGQYEEAVKYAWVAKRRADEVAGRISEPWSYVNEKQRSSFPIQIDSTLAALLGGALIVMIAGLTFFVRAQAGGIDSELMDYIDGRRDDGYDDDEIVSALLDAGYEKVEIYAAFGLDVPEELAEGAEVVTEEEDVEVSEDTESVEEVVSEDDVSGEPKEE